MNRNDQNLLNKILCKPSLQLFWITCIMMACFPLFSYAEESCGCTGVLEALPSGKTCCFEGQPSPSTAPACVSTMNPTAMGTTFCCATGAGHTIVDGTSCPSCPQGKRQVSDSTGICCRTDNTSETPETVDLCLKKECPAGHALCERETAMDYKKCYPYEEGCNSGRHNLDDASFPPPCVKSINIKCCLEGTTPREGVSCGGPECGSGEALRNTGQVCCKPNSDGSETAVDSITRTSGSQEISCCRAGSTPKTQCAGPPPECPGGTSEFDPANKKCCSGAVTIIIDSPPPPPPLPPLPPPPPPPPPSPLCPNCPPDYKPDRGTSDCILKEGRFGSDTIPCPPQLVCSRCNPPYVPHGEECVHEDGIGDGIPCAVPLTPLPSTSPPPLLPPPPLPPPLPPPPPPSSLHCCPTNKIVEKDGVCCGLCGGLEYDCTTQTCCAGQVACNKQNEQCCNGQCIRKADSCCDNPPCVPPIKPEKMKEVVPFIRVEDFKNYLFRQSANIQGVRDYRSIYSVGRADRPDFICWREIDGGKKIIAPEFLCPPLRDCPYGTTCPCVTSLKVPVPQSSCEYAYMDPLRTGWTKSDSIGPDEDLPTPSYGFEVMTLSTPESLSPSD